MKNTLENQVENFTFDAYGKVKIKEGNRIRAKIWDRNLFFSGNVNYKHRYALWIDSYGIRECDELEEVRHYLRKYVLPLKTEL